MDKISYDKVTKQLLSNAKYIEDGKRPGYTTGTDDVLSNFKRVGEQTSTIPEKIAMIYMLKHLDSIRTLLNNIDKGFETEDPEPWTGRLYDILNYVKLLHALLWEREGKPMPGCSSPRPTNGGSKS